jgi:UDP-glucose 4-epimerase
VSDRLALVTGGAGFIGSHLAEALLGREYRVRILDDFSSGAREALPAGGVEIVEGDLRDRGLVAASLKGVQLIYHQAAFVSVPDSFEDPQGCYETNVLGTLNLLSAAHEAGVERVVLASSAAVYGEADGPVTEDAPTSPQSPYAASKLAMEEAALLYYREHALPVVCLRYFNVYGPRQRPDSPYAAVIPAFIRAGLEGRPPVIYGDGEQRRDFVYVGDAVRANLLAAESEGAVGGVFNIGGGGSVSVNELARNLQTVLPKGQDPVYESPRQGDIRFSKADLSSAKRGLDYQPEIDLLAGLRLTVEWYAQQEVKAGA